MARNFFTGGSMPSFDTFLFFQKHLAIQSTWMINGVHYSKVYGVNFTPIKTYTNSFLFVPTYIILSSDTGSMAGVVKRKGI